MRLFKNKTKILRYKVKVKKCPPFSKDISIMAKVEERNIFGCLVNLEWMELNGSYRPSRKRHGLPLILKSKEQAKMVIDVLESMGSPIS